MVIREKLKNTITLLRQNGCENAVFEANLLMRSVMSLSATDLVIHHTSELPADKEHELDTLVQRRICGEPLQYIIGTQEFMSLEFIVDRSVLIPRADTETLVEFLLKQMNGKGSGLRFMYRYLHTLHLARNGFTDNNCSCRTDYNRPDSRTERCYRYACRRNGYGIFNGYSYVECRRRMG